MIWEFGRIQLLASTLNLCVHVPQLTVINLMWEKDSENNWTPLIQYFFVWEISEKPWEVVVSCEIYLVRKGFNLLHVHVLDDVFCLFLCVCTVGSGYSTLLLTFVFLLQTEMILKDCIKCTGLKYHSSVASRFPSMFDRASVFSWQSYFAFALIPALNFRSKVWVIWHSLCLARFGLRVRILYYKR